MRYAELSLENGVLVEKNVREIPQETLTSDCWMVQIKGLSACVKCTFENTPDCGGGKTLKNIKSSKRKG